MSVRVIWEVRQRSWNRLKSRELGMFTDDAMAEQTIQALYREAWKTVLNPAFEGSDWFGTGAYSILSQQGWDVWYPNDYNSAEPLFYKVPHRLWSQVPASMNNFTLTSEGEQLFDR